LRRSLRAGGLLPAAGLLAQALLLVALADLAPRTAASLIAGGCLAALVAVALWPRLSGALRTALAMLALGGLGMTLGWWADLGFASAAALLRADPEAAAAGAWCGLARPDGSAQGGLRLPLLSWMNAGMVVAGALTLRAVRGPSLRHRAGHLALETGAMLAGMNLGALLAARVAGRLPAEVAVVTAHASMNAGMLAGMQLAALGALRRSLTGHGSALLRRLLVPALLLALGARPDASARAQAEDLAVGVSWSNFQEERWKRDEAALREELERLGARYLSADAQSSSEKQLADVESLIARGARALVLVAHDADAIGPAVAAARAGGIPVLGYDRLIEVPGVFYLSFDNREVGRLQAREVLRRRPRGRYVFIKGSPQDPNSDLVHAGQLDVLRAAIDAGEIEVVGDQYVDRWLPEVAQRTFEQILTAAGNRVDAVVCSNDAMAGGVVAALRAQGLADVPVSGQDGDHAGLVRVAEGLQAVSVWKDSRALGSRAAQVAVALARGTPAEAIEGRIRFDGGPRRVPVDAILLAPVPVTRDNLHVVLDAGWIERAKLCRAGAPDPPPACR
jgi:D-xylose transport system substrate-binding protein